MSKSSKTLTTEMQSTEEGVEANIDEYASDDGSTRSKASKKKAPKTPEVAASFRETWSFAFDEDKRTIFLLIGGVIGGIGNGLVGFKYFRLCAGDVPSIL